MKRGKRIAASATTVYLLLALSFQPVARAQKKPNIIVILSDDHAYQALSAYQRNLTTTPNIDRIGKNGVVMDRAYVTNSVCSPSRAVLLTGKYSHRNGLRDNGTFFDGSQPTLPKILQQNGYKTAVIGKWHLWSDPTGFDYWNILPAQGHYYHPPFNKMGKDTAYAGYVTDVITDLSLNWIEQNKEKPFCLLLFHKAPHRNCMPPLKYLDRFEDRQFPLPANFFDDYKDRKGLQRQQITMANDLDIRYDSKIPCTQCPVTAINAWAPEEYQREIERLTPDERRTWDVHYAKEFAVFRKLKTRAEVVRFQYQRYLEDYLRCIQSVDDNVGRVLDYLQEKHLDSNTIVVYLSDQGFYLGEHGLYDKRFMYEESFRTPFLLSYPAVIRQHRRLQPFVMNLDLAPTLLDLAGIPVPSDMQGHSMKQLLTTGKDESWRNDMYYHYYERSFGLTPHFGVRTSRYKLLHFYGEIDSWELYDLEKDPHEMKNLYGKKAYAKTVAELKQRLASLQQQYGDPVKP